MSFIGVLPAAGQAKRLAPLRYPKELIPIGFRQEIGESRLHPFPVSEYALRAMAHAGVKKCTVVIADWKVELVRYYGDGSDLGLHLAYVNQSQPTGLADAVALTRPWLGDENVCLVLPDTVFQPFDAPKAVCEELARTDCDVALGVFPTDKPEQLGPVAFTADGTVTKVHEKPASPEFRNTWGMAAWSPRFTNYLDAHRRRGTTSEVSIGTIFDQAVRDGLAVRAVWWPAGEYIDVGVADGLAQVILQRKAERGLEGVLDPGT